MINWYIIGALVVLALILLKFKEIRHQLGIFIGLGILVFLVISFGTLSASNDLDLTSFDGVVSASKLYIVWLGNLFTNVKGISTYVVNQPWGINESIGK
ncbi:hypothetical protein J4461_01620 [Candidatus Pacearchaeota archaeon]|nr:hypothetical protein [Candidatus Pacearchaeota archaeon]